MLTNTVSQSVLFPPLVRTAGLPSMAFIALQSPVPLRRVRSMCRSPAADFPTLVGRAIQPVAPFAAAAAASDASNPSGRTIYLQAMLRQAYIRRIGMRAFLITIFASP